MSQNCNLKTVEMVNWVLGVFRHNFKINGKDTRVISRFSLEVTTKLISLRGCGQPSERRGGEDEASSRGASASGGGPGPCMKRSRRLTSTASWPVNASFSSKCLGIRTQLSAFFKTSDAKRMQASKPGPPTPMVQPPRQGQDQWCTRAPAATVAGTSPWALGASGFSTEITTAGPGREPAGLSQMLCFPPGGRRGSSL